MSNAAKSLLVFGLYLVALGSVLILVPDLVFQLFGLPKTSEVWIRVVGMLLLVLSFLDIQAARAELTVFFKWSLYTRVPVIGFLTAFVLLGFAKPILILVGAIDLLGAIWTGLALRSSQRAANE
jgi:hypothetical protein